MHNKFLLSALEQAWLGRGQCAPNPSVGAVAVQNANIIAQAFHSGAGKPHAEQLLLTQFPANTPGITLYVTLEPCNHWGKTPPCVDAIIQHGIERVVFAYRDPNPVVSLNDTSALLRRHGIDVIHHRVPEIDQFYQSYYHWTMRKKPWVTVKMAQTLDGKIAGPQGARVHLSNILCHELTHLARLRTDVILTTARTVIADDPQLNVRMKQTVTERTIAILDRTLSLSASATIFKTAAHTHIYYDDAYSVDNPLPNCTYHPTPALNKTLDLSFVLNHLGDMGFHDVWVEAGSTLFAALHEARLVNRTWLYLVPKILGEEATSLYQTTDIFKQAHSVSWQAKGDNMLAVFDWQEDVCLPV